MAEHTPGPWEEDITEDGLLRVIAPDAGDRHHETVCIIDDMETSTEQDHWNARLIAAAPELLVLLEESVASLNHYVVHSEDCPMCFWCDSEWDWVVDTMDIVPSSETHTPDCWVVRVRAAIAKARGSSDE